MNVVTAKVKRSYAAPADYGRASWGRRRWEAAQTHRLNQAHWRNAQEESINLGLQADLADLRARAIYEREQNAMLDGVVFTHWVDLVGRDGPELQVLSESEAYNNWLERHWKRWFRAPSPNPRRSGADLLRLGIQSLWTKGEFLWQKTTKLSVGTPVQMRLKPINPRWLGTPVEMSSNPNVINGIEFSPDGEPLRYWIAKSDSFDGESLTTQYDPIPAEDIIHFFFLREEEQARGVPWVASALDGCAELRDYDADVLEATRQAASNGVYWYADHVKAPFYEIDQSIEMERGTQSTGPPGWKPAMISPQQPQTQYVSYRAERQMELGRPVSMPGLIIRLSADEHNFASARFDALNYDHACEVIQSMLSGSEQSVGPLSELADDVAREAALSDRADGRPGPERPEEVVYEYTWPRPPRVDRKDDVEADEIELRSGTAAIQDILAKKGSTLERTIPKRQRANEKLKKAGLPPVPNVLTKGASFASHAAMAAAASDELPEEEENGGQKEEGAGQKEEVVDVAA